MNKRKNVRVKRDVNAKRDTGNPTINLDTYRQYARHDVYNYLVDERPSRANINNKIKEYKSFIKDDKRNSMPKRRAYTNAVIDELEFYYNNYDYVPFKRR